MFIVSLKANRKKVLLYILLALAVVLAAFVIFTGRSESAAAKKGAASVMAADNAQRIAYLKTFGWEVSEEPCEIVEVAIPTQFGDVYTEYNKIQKKQGFDLEPYAGRRVKRFTYTVTNYPGQTENIRANLLIYQEEIIGGDICSTKLDGFMHGFALPKK